MGITGLQVYFTHINSTTEVLQGIYFLQYIILAVNNYLYQIRNKFSFTPTQSSRFFDNYTNIAMFKSYRSHA
jgi:hypothetical protein